MAEPGCPYWGAHVPPHQDQQTQGSEYQHDYGFTPGSSNLRSTPQHNATAPPFRQSFGSNWQRQNHFQHVDYQYAGGFPQAAYIGGTGVGFQQGPTGTMATYNSDANPLSWSGRERNPDGSYNDQSMARPSYTGMDLSSLVNPPTYPHWAYPPAQYPSRHLGRHASSITPLSFPEPELNADAGGGYTYTNRDASDQQERVPSLRRLSFSRHPRQGVQDTTNTQQRRSMFRPSSGSSPLPDLVPLSRSNRRSFDRYSNDIQNDGSGSNGPVRSLPSRVAGDRPTRRPRAMAHPSVHRARYFAQPEHPNVPTPGQMQALRDKLRHFLPKELPEGIDATCDICQKDYSAKHVDPTEDEEIAIQLPCKHVFGEHCINTWFDTCKKDKHKITCPMCRKVLIEPMARAGGLSSRALLEGLQRFRRHEMGLQFPEGVPPRGINIADAGAEASSNLDPGRLDGA